MNVRTKLVVAALLITGTLTTNDDVFHFPAHDDLVIRRTSFVSPEQLVLCIPVRPFNTGTLSEEKISRVD